MTTMIDKKCKHCKNTITVRMVDHKRGWGNFCDKSCKAKYQENRNGQYAAYMNGRGVSNLHPGRLKDYDRDDWDDYVESIHPFSSEGLGQWDD